MNNASLKHVADRVIFACIVAQGMLFSLGKIRPPLQDELSINLTLLVLMIVGSLACVVDGIASVADSRSVSATHQARHVLKIMFLCILLPALIIAVTGGYLASFL